MVSRPVQEGVDQPAAAHMRPWNSTMVKDVGVVAACFFQGVGQHWQMIEGPFLANRLG
jgi:hypothetical protein